MEDTKCLHGRFLRIILILFFFLLSTSQFTMAGTRVKYLPGFDGPLPFYLETGYIGIGQSEEVQLFYYFIKSESDPQVDPLVLWLVGGPGCSGLYAIANEIGPVRFDSREYNGSLPTLSYNQYAYTKCIHKRMEVHLGPLVEAVSSTHKTKDRSPEKSRSVRASIMEDTKCLHGRFLRIILILFFFLLSTSQFTMAGTRVKYLPGFDGPLPFYLETGYIGIGQSEEVQLFYYFIKSESDPQVDPLVLWLVGGPGCSGLYAIANEIGPVRFDSREYNGSLPTLSYNQYAYTKVANIIFIDSPVGTGFSYSQTKNGRHSDTHLAAEQAYQFLRKWLVENPQYQSNPFYVGGDSYGGIFVPITTRVISDGIEAGLEPRVNLKGYVLGNPLTFIFGEDNYKIPFAHGMSLISDELYESLERHCGGEYQEIDPKNTLCLQHVHTFNQLLTGIYVYHILEPVCDSISTKVHNLSSQRRSLDEKFEKLKSPITLPGMKCRGHWWHLSEKWANVDVVREALHVRKGTIGIWVHCNNKLPFTRSINNTVPYHAYLSTKGYRSLIYSGDHDLSVPFQSTQAWIKSLNYSIIEDWRPWTFGGQIAGYTKTYSNRMTYATVKGSGHTAPEWNPAECLTMLRRWLYYKSL